MTSPVTSPVIGNSVGNTNSIDDIELQNVPETPASNPTSSLKADKKTFAKTVGEYMSDPNAQEKTQEAARQRICAGVSQLATYVQTPVIANKLRGLTPITQATPESYFSNPKKIFRALQDRKLIQANSNRSAFVQTAAKAANAALNLSINGIVASDVVSTLISKYTFLALNSVLGFLPGGKLLSTAVAAVVRAVAFVALATILFVGAAVVAGAVVGGTILAASVSVAAAVLTSPFYIAAAIVRYIDKKEIDALKKEVDLQAQVNADLAQTNFELGIKFEDLKNEVRSNKQKAIEAELKASAILESTTDQFQANVQKRINDAKKNQVA